MRFVSLTLLCAVLSCSAERAEPTPSTTVTAPQCRMLGRVVDSSGTPLQGVLLSFGPVSDVWLRGAAPSDFTAGGQGGIECVTGADGRFECTTLVPTAEWVVLMVQPDRFHLRASRGFGKGGTEVTPRLQAGDNDLGDIVLDPAGAIAGSVVAANGDPVANAVVSVASSFPGGLSVNAKSDAGGQFVLEHVPSGTFLLDAKREGFVATKSHRVTVETGGLVQGPRIAMARASTISGQVVDEKGLGVPNAQVIGYAQQGAGHMCYATTAADGSFRLQLNHHVGHTLEVKALTCETFQGREVFEPGAIDVRIGMTTMAMGTFRVIDAVTNEPIESFRLIFSDQPVDERTSADWAPFRFPGGVAHWPAEPGKRFLRVRAKGYAVFAGPVQWNGETPRTQILRLTQLVGGQSD